MPSNNYTRQKTAEIQDNLVINASIFNAEYNQIQLAFSYNSTGETGHTHSGAIGEGGAIGKIGNQDFSKSLEISTNDWIFTGSSVQPATNNTTDLGVSGKRWKDVYISGNVDLADNAKARFGTGNDLQIWHSGANSFIQDSGDGQLVLTTTNGVGVYIESAGETMGQFISNGAVTLHHDGVQKFATTSTGINVTGKITVESASLGNTAGDQVVQAEFTADNANNSYLRILDERHTGGTDWTTASKRIQFGIDTSDHAFIASSTGDVGVGLRGLLLGTHDGAGGEEKFIACDADGGVTLYYDNAKKLETTNTGIDVTGDVAATTVTVGDSTGTNLELYEDSSQNAIIKQRGTGGLQISGVNGSLANDNYAQLVSWDADNVNLSWQGATGAGTKLATAETGIDVTGTVTADAIKFTTDATDDAKIFTESSGGEQTSLVIQSKDNLDDLIILRHHIASVGGVDTLTTESTGATFRGYFRFKPQTGNPTGTFLIRQTADGSGLIEQANNGNLLIRGQVGFLQNNSGDSLLQWGASDVALYWRGANFGQRLVTTEAGIDVTGTVEADSFKGTSTTTITDFVTNVGSNDNNTTVPTSGAVKAYVDLASGGGVSLADTLALGNTTGTNDIHVASNQKITFGGTVAPNLSIYESSNGNSYVQQEGSGSLYIQGQNGFLRSDAGDVASWGSNDIALKYNAVNRLLTTNAGIDVTGTTNTDNLTINGAQGTNGQVLTSTGSGVAWEDAATGGGGSVTGVTGTAPIVSSGGTSPAISITQASGSTNGYLSSSDWTTFNSKGTGTLTGVGEGTAIDINTSNPANPVISVDLSELNVGADNLVGSADHLVYLDGGNQKKILANNVNLSAFDNDVGWTNNAGTVTSVSGGTGISVSSGTTTPSVSITSNSIGATQLNVSGNGATTEFLRSDGDGTFTWAIPADTDTTYTADNTTIDLTGTQFSVKDNSIGATQLNVSGNGSTAQFLRSDGDGTFTWATPVDTDTNTTYTAGTGLSLNGTQFNLSLNELSTTTTADNTDHLVLAGTVGNQILLENIDNHLFGQDVQELTGFGPPARRANSIKVFNTSSGDIAAAWATSVEGAYYTVHVIGPNDVNYVIPDGTTVYITGPSGLITRTSGTVTIKSGSSCTVTAYGSSEKFIYTGNNVTYS